MTQRLNFMTKKNGGLEALIAVEGWIAKSFDPKLLTQEERDNLRSLMERQLAAQGRNRG